MEYASKGVAGAGLGLGIAGTALGILNGGGMLAGLGNGYGCGYGNGYGYHIGEMATMNDLRLSQEVAARDAEIALLKSENDAEKKMVEVYTALDVKTNKIREELQAFKDAQSCVNAQQGIVNATMGSDVRELQRILGSLTRVVIPNGAICPGWGEVTVTPVPVTPPNS